MNRLRRLASVGTAGDGFVTPCGVVPAAETKALVFDGTSDYAYAEDVIDSSGDYSIFVKLANGNPGGSDKTIFQSSDPNAAGAGDLAGWADVFQDHVPYYRALGYETDGVTSNYSRQSSSEAAPVTSAPIVAAIVRDQAANKVRIYVYRCDTGAAVWVPPEINAAVDSTPLDMAFGGGLTKALAPIAGYYTAIQLVGAGSLVGKGTATQFQAYATGRDARPVFGSMLNWYVSVSSLTGSGPIQPLRGTSPLVLSGPNSGDLVNL